MVDKDNTASKVWKYDECFEQQVRSIVWLWYTSHMVANMYLNVKVTGGNSELFTAVNDTATLI